MSRWSRIFLLLMIGVAAFPYDLYAQSWTLDASAGRSTYNIAPLSVANRTGVVGIRYNQDRRFLQGSFGMPLSSDDLTWGAFELGDRFAVRRKGFEAGADLSVLAHGHRDPVADTTGRGLMAEVLPVISHNIGAGVVEVQSGVRRYGTRYGDTDLTRTLWSTSVRGSVEPSARLLA